jgi:hypothetical protein
MIRLENNVTIVFQSTVPVRRTTEAQHPLYLGGGHYTDSF